MKVGVLGDIVFEVSDKAIKTFQKSEYSGAAKIQIHSRHGKVGLVEWTGRDPKTHELTFKVSKHLGATPEDDIKKIEKYVKEGTKLSLTIFKKKYGNYLIQKYNVSEKDYDKKSVSTADISVSLIEYTKV
ncbi:MAG: phage tail protein [Acutalibacteraceae bacterium]